MKILKILLMFFIAHVMHAESFQQEPSLADIMNVYNESVSLQNYGVAAYVRHNDKVESYAMGIAGDGIPMTADKVFNIASLTKTFTAVLVLQEVEKCNLKLNDTIGKWFKGNKNVSGSISIEQLLRQTSGLSEVVDVAYAETVFLNPDNEYNHSDLYNKIGEAIAKPGEFYKYRNTNYILLGYILEKLNQKPYGTLVKERVFEVCGMKNSYWYYSNTINNAAHPMTAVSDLFKVVNYEYYKNYSFSAAGIASTPEDLNLFFQKLYTTNILISRESFTYMSTFNDDDYGMGLQRYKYKDVYLYGHGGDNISFKLRNYYNPLNNNILIIASNRFGDMYMDKITNAILSAYGF